MRLQAQGPRGDYAIALVEVEFVDALDKWGIADIDAQPLGALGHWSLAGAAEIHGAVPIRVGAHIGRRADRDEFSNNHDWCPFPLIGRSQGASRNGGSVGVTSSNWLEVTRGSASSDLPSRVENLNVMLWSSHSIEVRV